MNNGSRQLPTNIPGWGVDLNPRDRPGIPRERTPAPGTGGLRTERSYQHPTVKVFQSIEHASMTPVVGTTAPPRGLSGLLRAYAYRFGEGRLRRWMTLMLADRVDVVEGIVGDVAHGHIPNIPAEMGLRSELRYNRAGFARKTFFLGAGTLAVATLLGVLRGRRAEH